MWRDNNPLKFLAHRLRNAASADAGIFASVLDICPRIATLRKAGKAGSIDRLLANGAWTDAALTMIAMEMPGWSVRRLVYEGEEWICSLSRQPNLPLNVDDTVDAGHATLALAILSALLEARARADACLPHARTVPQVEARPENVLCSDNFA